MHRIYVIIHIGLAVLSITITMFCLPLNTQCVHQSLVTLSSIKTFTSYSSNCAAVFSILIFGIRQRAKIKIFTYAGTSLISMYLIAFVKCMLLCPSIMED